MIYPRHERTTEDVGKHYDALDKWYRAIWGEHVHHGLWETGSESAELAVLKLAQRVASETGIARGARVVDIGCGYGATARMLAHGFGAHVIGYTVSPAQYEYAVKISNGDPNCEYRHADWLHNDLPDASCDIAIAIESTEHIQDKPALFRQIRRVLKPGGRIGVCSWLSSDGPRPWESTYLLQPICEEGCLPSLCSPSDCLLLLKDAGFVDVRHQDLTHNVKKTWAVVLWRMAKRLSWDGEARKHLWGGPSREFAKTVLRLLIAYNVGAMQYGLFSGTTPDEQSGDSFSGEQH